jgi:hypothetical protein
LPDIGKDIRYDYVSLPRLIASLQPLFSPVVTLPGSRSVDEVYRRFYFRPRKMISLGAEMLRDRAGMRRRLSEGRESLRFLRKHRAEAPVGV